MEYFSLGLVRIHESFAIGISRFSGHSSLSPRVVIRDCVELIYFGKGLSWLQVGGNLD